MPGELRMSKDEMRAGFLHGRTLTQEEWAHPQEVVWVNELIAEGKATATEWKYHDNFQCEMRKITGIPGEAMATLVREPESQLGRRRSQK